MKQVDVEGRSEALKLIVEDFEGDLDELLSWCRRAGCLKPQVVLL